MVFLDKILVQLFSAIDDDRLARRQATSLGVSSTPSQAAAATSASASASTTSSPSNGPTSSPLLFFVALGFGVVFTNLWIIVGVKYCFRYNARNRAARAAEANGEPINMDNVPRPHRRRREKKLLTMDEVNERFPMSKYRSWVAAREREGLPTSGGVTAPETRPDLGRGVEEVMTSAPMEFDFTDAKTDTKSDASVNKLAILPPNSGEDVKSTGVTTIEEKGEMSPAGGDDHHALENVQTTASNEGKPLSPEVDDDEDDDDQIHTAVPPELLTTPGDTCAICIDALEADDDIRGLTCGHAFHAGCIDPWLTARRASCPLCKADYYVPKPRPAGADAVAGVDPSFQIGPGGINLPQPPRAARSHASRRDLLGLGLMDRRRDNLAGTARNQSQSVAPNGNSGDASRSWRPNFRAALNSLNFRPHSQRHQQRISPSQLEAGTGRSS